MTTILSRTLAATLLALTVSAPAAAAERHSFTQDGRTYDYSTEVRADSTIISGRSSPDGAPFRLTVQGDQVRGTVAGSVVAFRVPAKPAVELSQR